MENKRKKTAIIIYQHKINLKNNLQLQIYSLEIDTLPEKKGATPSKIIYQKLSEIVGRSRKNTVALLDKNKSIFFDNSRLTQRSF